MLVFKLAWKFLKRELSQGELSLLFIAIFIAISSLSSIGFLLKRIDRSMLGHAAQLNGAELILKSPIAIKDNWLKQARNKNLKQALMVSFPSMLVVNETFKLAQVKAVSNNFPLLGKLTVKATIEQAAQNKKAPSAGNIWLDRRLFHYFKLATASSTNNIELGEALFSSDGILESVPGQSSSLFTIAPTAIINLADLDKTATIQAGSRVEYIYFFSGTEQNLKYYQHWLKNKITAGQSLRYGVEGVRAVSSSIKKAGDFLSLSALLTVLLSAIAISISSYRYGQKQFKNNAILLCLGLSEATIIQIELLKLILLGFIASLSGVACGYLVHLLLLEVLAELIPQPIPALSFVPIWMGLGSGILLIVSISIANLFHLKQLSPMAILRKDDKTTRFNHYLLYSMSLLALLLLSWFYTQDMKISLLFYALIFVTMLILFIIARFIIQILLSVNKDFKFIPKLTAINLRQHKTMALLQISTFSLIFALVLIIYLSRTELLQQWQQQLPENTPNHFVINIQAYETEPFKQLLINNNIQANDIFPMVRGRFSMLNGQPIKQLLDKTRQAHNALNRELNLSFAATMPAHNQLVKGKWWDANRSEQNINGLAQISLESSLAKELGLKIGDKLGFQIGSQQVQGVVSNLRKVQWDSFKPNFYVIFPTNSLESFPLTYISSFHLAQQDKLFLNQLIEQFPGITIIEVDQILKEVQYIIEKIAIAINFIFVFILIAALLVLASSLSSTLESRMYENAIIRTLGASAKTLRFSLFIEFSIIAVLSALMGLVIAEVVSAVLYQQIFNLNYSFHPWLWLLAIIIALILIVGMGLALVNKIFNRSVNYSLKQFSS
ncbi:MAG: FtsX-like permease family protein [Pseudomonadota bacterium]